MSDIKFKNDMIDIFLQAKNEKFLNFLINNKLPITSEIIDLLNEVSTVDNMEDFNISDIKHYTEKLNIKENFSAEIFKE